MKTVCVVTSSRADYGYLRGLIKEIKEDRSLKLKLIVTGSHLSRRHGLTYKEIEKDGFKADIKVPILNGADSQRAIADTIAKAIAKVGAALSKIKPDAVILLGDRYEIFAVASAAYVLNIPIVHLHGGETTQGVMDEAFRHSMTKMAYIHFAATDEYRHRIIQLGENPKRVYNFGTPGLDYLHRQKYLSRAELSKVLSLDINQLVALVTYHPVTLEKQSPALQVKNMLKAIKRSGVNAVFTQANADAYGTIVNKMIKSFVNTNPLKYKFIENLGQVRYFSCLKHFDVMIGNSSSGIIESSSFGIPVVNIGDRQKGRLAPKNVIHSDNSQKSIEKAIAKAVSPGFLKSLRGIKNPYLKYTDGRVSERIKQTLKSLIYKKDWSGDNLKKAFFNIRFKC